MLIKTYTEQTFTLEILYHVGVYENSIHFIFDHASKTCAIIDPAWKADLFIQRIVDKGYTLTDIWLTHWHGDHTNAVDELSDKTEAKITVGVNEVPYLDIAHDVHIVDDGNVVHLGETTAQVINTPGHTAGGICYLLDRHLIAGDTLFVFGAGHCSMPGGNVREFYHSMQKLKQVDDNAMLHCGHNYGCKIETIMGEQKAGNAYLLIDNEADFLQYVNGMSAGKYPYPTEALSKTEVQTMLL